MAEESYKEAGFLTERQQDSGLSIIGCLTSNMEGFAH